MNSKFQASLAVYFQSFRADFAPAGVILSSADFRGEKRVNVERAEPSYGIL
jgi:hypothetical protein